LRGAVASLEASCAKRRREMKSANNMAAARAVRIAPRSADHRRASPMPVKARELEDTDVTATGATDVEGEIFGVEGADVFDPPDVGAMVGRAVALDSTVKESTSV
jgi:hypothetical protein